MSAAPIRRFRQHGISLISLMIALTLATFLLAGLFNIWFQTRKTFTAQAQLAQLQDSERMALTIMANTVQTGGYFPAYLNYAPIPPSPIYSLGNSYTPLASFGGQSVGFASQQVFYGVHSGTAPGDQLYVRFLADKPPLTGNNTPVGASNTAASPNNTLDCQGQAEATGTLVVNVFQVSPTNNLECSTDGTTWQYIVGGVQNLTVLYGVDTTGQGSATQYMTADNVTAKSYWKAIKSVNLQLTFLNPLYPQPGQAQYLPVIQRIVAVTQNYR